MILFSWHSEAFWLLDVDNFIEGAVEKCSIYVHLMDRGLPATGKNGKEGSNGGVLCHRGESFVIVFPPSLGEALGTESCLVEAVVFGAEYPARFDSFCFPRAWNEIPGLILHD